MKKTLRLLKSILAYLTIFLNRFGERIKYDIKVKNYLARNPQKNLTKDQNIEIENFFAEYGFRGVGSNWHRFYSGMGGKYNKRFIPNTLFYSKLESSLNRQDFSRLQDKNLLSSLFINANQPRTIIKNVNGFFQKEGKLITREEAIAEVSNIEKCLIKPSIDTGGGKGVRIISKNKNNKDGIDIDLNVLFIEYNKDFIVQYLLEQSEDMSLLNESSINTIRIVSYLRENESVVLSSIVRIGGIGSETDNLSSGGMGCPIDEYGNLQEWAYSYNDKSYLFSKANKTANGTRLNGFVIPNYSGIEAFIKALHFQIPYFKLVSWDIALDRNNSPVLIEFNVFGQGLGQQAQCGPFFGKYTEEILKEASNSM